MKKLLLIFLFPIILQAQLLTLFSESTEITYADTARSFNYYVDNTGTGDTLSAIAEVNALSLQGLDTVFFKRGCEWREQLTVPSSGISGYPIVFTSYGTGDKPILSGSDLVTGFDQNFTNLDQIFINDSTDIINPDFTWGGWIALSGATKDDANSFTTTQASGIKVNTIFTNAKWYKIIISGSTSASGFIVIQGTSSGTRITLSETLTGSFSAEIVFQASNVTELDLYLRNLSAGTTDITSFIVYEYDVYIWQKSNILVQPYLAFISDVVGTLQDTISSCDSTNDWFWDISDSSLYVYSTTDPSGNVEIGQRINTVDMDDQTYVSLQNLTLQHSNGRDESVWSGALRIWATNGTDHITIDSCTIQNNNNYGAFCYNASNITFNNCTFTNNGLNSTGYLHYADNVRFYSNTTGNSNIIFTNNINNNSNRCGLLVAANHRDNEYRNITISGNQFNNIKSAGIYLVRTDTSVIFNNTFDSCGDPIDDGEDYAIANESSDNMDIYNNTITNMLNNDAIQIWSDSSALYGSANNVRIFRNSITHVINGDGISFIGDDSTTDNAQVYYNLIDSVDHYGILYYKYKDTGASSLISIYNNTITNSGYGNFGATANGGASVSNFPCILKNNIFYNLDTINVDLANSTTGLVSANNLYYSYSNVLKYNSTTYTSLTITGLDATAQVTDPLFTTEFTDLSLQTGSPAINNGTDVGLTQDILGNPIVGNPDIGAYEKQ